MLKRIVFLTGTRADYGKIRSLIAIAQQDFEVHIFVTGMHMNQKYGETWDEIRKAGFPNQFPFYNHTDADTMDSITAQTMLGFSHFVKNKNPDMIILHGDRPETLAGAIVGSFNNILTAHIEGGEVSGTLDESIRHSVTKLSHVHFVSNEQAAGRILQMGEEAQSIFTIGSPGMDVIFSKELPAITEVKEHYGISFEKYSMVLFHPVTTEFEQVQQQARKLVEALIESEGNYVVVYPNNDHGADFILAEYQKIQTNERFKIYPSLRHTSYLTLLKNSASIIGNSSSGIQEAPCYGVPTVNIGTRQNGREISAGHIIHCGYGKEEIAGAIHYAGITKVEPSYKFGEGNSAELFLEVLKGKDIWNISCQKKFIDR